ncbi:Agamous-like MADS-box protein AGL97 [Cardamine amara subsp. amara]|uniref:Agamous-like MADS-box protein AGL97 n=1 Tax=Cardamine amara subsp. amara TaxID=228776 RepID=A0ABD1B8N8_CARAN
MIRGIKRKIPLKKIEKKDSRAIAFSRRSKGLYSKASDLCLLSGGKIAIIATPVSSNSNVSFYSFGHSSVDSVVSAFLANTRPREDDDDLGFWWSDEGLARSENPDELREAMNSMSKMLQDLKDMEKRGDHEKKGVLHATHQKQTLDLQSSSTSANFEGFNKNSEEQILTISDNNNSSELGLDQIFDIVKSQGPSMNLEMDDVSMVTTNQNQLSVSEVVEELMMQNRDWYENNFVNLSDIDENQILLISDNNNNNDLPGNNEGRCDQELDLDQIIDFEAFEDVGSVIHRESMNSISKMLEDLKDMEKRGDHEDVEEKSVLHGTHQNQTLDLQSSSTSSNFEGFNKNSEEQILAISDINNNNNSGLAVNLDGIGANQELGLDQIFDLVKSQGPSMNLDTDDVSMVTRNQNPLSDSEAVEELMTQKNLVNLSDIDENQILSISDNNNASPGSNEGWFDQELNLDDISDFEAFAYGGSVIHRDLDEDDLHFSDFFNEFASITAL